MQSDLGSSPSPWSTYEIPGVSIYGPFDTAPLRNEWPNSHSGRKGLELVIFDPFSGMDKRVGYLALRREGDLFDRPAHLRWYGQIQMVKSDYFGSFLSPFPEYFTFI